MSTLSGRKPSARQSMFRANPILNRLSKMKEESTSSDLATYGGIASKTTFFLVLTLAGIVLQQIVMQAMQNESALATITLYEKFTVTFARKEIVALAAAVIIGFIAELLGIFVTRTVPVTGSIYSVSQGYVISFLVFKVLKGYEYLGLEALLLTVVVVAVMSWLYKAGVIKDGKKYRLVMLSLVLGSIGFSLLSFLGSLIPFTRPYVQTMMQNPGLTIALDVIGLVIAALFLISDFSMIDRCVKDGYPKQYEWSAAFGLVFTVLWIYLKILDLLMQFSGKDDK